MGRRWPGVSPACRQCPFGQQTQNVFERCARDLLIFVVVIVRCHLCIQGIGRARRCLDGLRVRRGRVGPDEGCDAGLQAFNGGACNARRLAQLLFCVFEVGNAGGEFVDVHVGFRFGWVVVPSIGLVGRDVY